ncbi:MAG: hypothetical protein ACLGHP_11280, partial [Vicinamibacteria bacterium]
LLMSPAGVPPPGARPREPAGRARTRREAAMIEFFALATLAMVGLAVAALIGVVLFAIKAVVWLVLLPFRILFKVLTFGAGLAFGAVGLVAGLALLPVVLAVVAVIAIVAVVGAILSLLLPAIPFILLGLVVWALMRKPAAVPAA